VIEVRDCAEVPHRRNPLAPALTSTAIAVLTIWEAPERMPHLEDGIIFGEGRSLDPERTERVGRQPASDHEAIRALMATAASKWPAYANPTGQNPWGWLNRMLDDESLFST
jgi:hypothetical protein